MVHRLKRIEKLKIRMLKRIKPTKKEHDNVHEFIRELISVARIKSGHDAIVCGSLGKDDWLRGDHDIDLFITYPKSYSREALENRGLAAAKAIAKTLKAEYKIKFAEHPYLQMFVKDFKIDIVPCFSMKKGEHIKSAVDRSPLHLGYVLQTLNAGLRDDVRLLKRFLKGIEVYGSDTKTEGFSGYLCELLIINYGKFEDVVKAMSRWKPPVVIDIENAIKSEDAIKKFKGNALIVIDPVDSNRNVAAVLSTKNLARAVCKSKQFTENPSEEFFFPKPSPTLTKKEINELKARETKFMTLVMEKPDIIDDTLYPQLRRAMKRLVSLLKENEFEIMRSFIYGNEKEIAIVLELEIWELPFIKKMIGPPLNSQKHSKEFLSKYKTPLYGPFVEGDNWAAEKKREFKDAARLLETFLAQNLNELNKKGIPEQICPTVFKGKLMEHHDFWLYARKDKGLSAKIRQEYFERTII